MSATYLVKSQARALAAHAGDPDRHGFLLGTSNLRGPNEIRLLRYYEEDNEIDCAAVYAHPGEVASISACPYDASVVLTVSSIDGAPVANVWRMRDLPGDPEGSRFSDAAATSAATVRELDKVAAFPSQPRGCRLLHAQFCPASEGESSAAAPASSRILTVDDTSIRLWELRGDGSAAASVGSSGPLRCSRDIPAGDVSFVGGASWDTLHPHDVAVACDSSVHVWDTRAGERTRAIERAVPSAGCVRSVSYNGNKAWHLATGGDDYRVKIWDLRKPSLPVKVLEGHSHWVTCVAFNAFHDQLVLSGGSDGRVNLWRASSVSSAPLLELGDEEIFAAEQSQSSGGGHRKAEPKLAPDTAIRSHEEHEDSVYAACWSASTAWVYASLSYQGRLLVAQVPSADKYRILL